MFRSVLGEGILRTLPSPTEITCAGDRGLVASRIVSSSTAIATTVPLDLQAGNLFRIKTLCVCVNRLKDHKPGKRPTGPDSHPQRGYPLKALLEKPRRGRLKTTGTQLFGVLIAMCTYCLRSTLPGEGKVRLNTCGTFYWSNVSIRPPVSRPEYLASAFRRMDELCRMDVLE